MSEPQAVADHVEEVVPGVLRWSIHDERIGFVSSAYAVDTVLVDPLPLEDEPLDHIGGVTAICLTSGSHERSAWRYRRELGVPVYAPAPAKEIEEEPDERYGDGDTLPGGLRAYFTPGAGTTQHTFVHDATGAAFVPDLLLKGEGRELEVCPAEYAYDPEEQRRSLDKILGLPFSVLCLAHGPAITDDPKTAIRAALAQYES